MTKVDIDPVKDGQSKTKESKIKSTIGVDNVSNGVDIKKLLESGAHFGHSTSRWHPKMAPYLHSKRDGSHIIDLATTVVCLEKATEFIEKTTKSGKQVLIVGTKRQAKDAVKQVATQTHMPYVNERWVGGMLTNVDTIGSRIKRLKDFEQKMESGYFASKFNKLEIQRFQEEIDEMNHLYGGIKNMDVKLGAVFVADVNNDINAVREARKLGVPVVAIVDSNADPSLVDFPIPANDDAIKSVALILNYIEQAIQFGKAGIKEVKEKSVETVKTGEEK